ncbi:SOS response-associated peptidase [Psychrobacillus sp. FSL W7-1457]|uniref:SOS response-associated peptidase n=1 Tax=unclassified Psychrobacillus TaxID=2636677 RepID=UPI0030FC7D27
MCGRFSLYTDMEQIKEQFDVQFVSNEEDYYPNYNIAPSQSVVAIINDGTSNRMGQLRWGLIPSWAKDEKIGYKMINARSETVDEKPSYRNAFTQRRCIIPMNSFYEWTVNEKEKVPMLIKMKNNELFGVAGIWETWKRDNEETVHSCTILTTEANSLVKTIHDRMPVILPPEKFGNWLDPNLRDKDRLKAMLNPYESNLMQAYPVSKEVNTPKNNYAELLNSL